MAQLAAVWRLVGPMIVLPSWVSAWFAAMRGWTLALLRVTFAFAVALGVFGLTMLVATEIVPSDSRSAAVAYGLALGAAAWLATCAGALVARQSQQAFVANGVATLAMALPAGMAVAGALAGHDPTGYLTYILGSGAGGALAVRVLAALPLVRTAPRRA
ncbi:MAG: hypothetical protein WDN25_27620 [Acetobacteraceae bacterium]